MKAKELLFQPDKQTSASHGMTFPLSAHPFIPLFFGMRATVGILAILFSVGGTARGQRLSGHVRAVEGALPISGAVVTTTGPTPTQA